MSELGFVGTALTVLAAAGAFALAYFQNATRLMKRVDELTSRVFALQDELSSAKLREGDLKAELAAALARIRALETATGNVLPPQLAGIVIADLRGVIKEFSPALTPIFQWLPKEVLGKPVTTLIPPDIRPRHEEMFARAVLDPALLDPGRELMTYGLTKTGGRVPIGVTLHGWRAGDTGLITATIRQRAQADAGPRLAPGTDPDPQPPRPA